MITKAKAKEEPKKKKKGGMYSRIFTNQSRSIDHSHVGGAAYSSDALRNWTMFLQDRGYTTKFSKNKQKKAEKNNEH